MLWAPCLLHKIIQFSEIPVYFFLSLLEMCYRWNRSQRLKKKKRTLHLVDLKKRPFIFRKHMSCLVSSFLFPVAYVRYVCNKWPWWHLCSLLTCHAAVTWFCLGKPQCAVWLLWCLPWLMGNPQQQAPKGMGPWHAHYELELWVSVMPHAVQIYAEWVWSYDCWQGRLYSYRHHGKTELTV